MNEVDYLCNTEDGSLLVVPFSINGSDIPKEIFLGQNYPNPFKKSSIISYVLPKPSNVKLQIYNLKGQLIQTLINEDKPAGYHTVEWNVPEKSRMSSGIYFYKLSTPNKAFIKKMILIR